MTDRTRRSSLHSLSKEGSEKFDNMNGWMLTAEPFITGGSLSHLNIKKKKVLNGSCIQYNNKRENQLEGGTKVLLLFHPAVQKTVKNPKYEREKKKKRCVRL